jgi:hypothetical protein
MAAFAVTVPVTAFNVETVGCACPAGHAVRKPRMPGGIAVKFREYACAVDGIPQLLERTGKVRAVLATRDGPPNGPVAFLVSAIRHGVSGKNARAPLVVAGTK